MGAEKKLVQAEEQIESTNLQLTQANARSAQWKDTNVKLQSELESKKDGWNQVLETAKSREVKLSQCERKLLTVKAQLDSVAVVIKNMDNPSDLEKAKVVLDDAVKAAFKA